MARIGFLSHSDMSVYYFRSPIMRALKARGHDVFAIIPDGVYTSKVQNEFKTAVYDIDKASLNPMRVYKDTNDLAKVLKSLNLDMLQTGAHKSNVFGSWAAKKVGIKTIINLVEGLGSFYIHNDIKTLIVRKIIELLYKRAFKISDACIFVNDSDPDYMIKKGLIDKSKVRRIKSVGVNASEFDPNLVEPFWLSDKKVVLMVGRALWDKGIREFYEAAGILSHRKDCEFVFVGDGYAGNPSSADEQFLKNKNVKWLKWSDNIKEILKGSYVYVLPSYKEGFPRTVLEAMSMGLPSVVSNCSGNIEAVSNGINGLVCNTKDPHSLAKNIEILLDDEELASRMGKSARELVLRQYDEHIIVEKYLEVYKEFIDV
ncbi:N,N'-diacetylbacillosaminyl-diphospho-undecaprenol alpha-1,3-N-acetylgalactosaminyltransferase [Campylobacter hyointestinalis]|uniref:N, N'-diacetylbacillosaminyl-diphospho-undecaprenol alpha-1,3-N-acetylgalactosaminyltransferase n=1 Tax=Campylobacter hyointestinalis TaxID=198 RepID=UPI000DCDCB04|nr:N,N'-diacetylbacillosaminyl-diphospho-undecaprenol alpha-1,3-N-acetylgalactosaminyltransferase [Campylobacter hyointestinalis]RAZ51715.1 N,N'-diacetylbacillosaminyl-diphospho-undecaprenol alpha-1,3-N-acetylgalactosaminyltransferase [Campylobacter hyointestinalis subsp. lawsonii]